MPVLRPCLSCGVLLVGSSRCRPCSTVERRPRGTPGTPDHERLHQAVAFVVAQARARDISVDEEFITAAVEAAVLGLGHPTPPLIVTTSADTSA